jgi:protein arginine N-methyltransferase 1
MLGIDAAHIIDFHRYMLADPGRTESYQKAIAQTVRPGDVVVDIGTGTGILAFFAAQAGAQKVYAIEGGPAIELARAVAARNALQDRVVFLNEQSHHTILPERVDVIICEILGSIALQGGILGLIIDARKRMLKEGGRIIPKSLTLSVVPVEVPKLNDELGIWKPDLYGFDFSPIQPFAVNNFYNFKCEQENFLSGPQPLGAISFAEAESGYVKGTAAFEITHPGILHGVAGWLSLELIAGITITNSPTAPNVHWGHAFFPIDTPITVNTGDGVTVALSTNDGEEWRWQVEVTRPGRGKEANQARKQRFDQSTFFGFPLNRRSLTATAKPRLSRRGEAEQFILSRLNGERTLADVQQELTASYGDLFPSPHTAAAFTKEVVKRNS